MSRYYSKTQILHHIQQALEHSNNQGKYRVSYNIQHLSLLAQVVRVKRNQNSTDPICIPYASRPSVFIRYQQKGRLREDSPGITWCWKEDNKQSLGKPLLRSLESRGSQTYKLHWNTTRCGDYWSFVRCRRHWSIVSQQLDLILKEQNGNPNQVNFATLLKEIRNWYWYCTFKK